MRKLNTAVLTLAMMIFVTSCSQARRPDQIWEASERLALGREQNGVIVDPTTGNKIAVGTVEKLISVPLDLDQPSVGNFKLYYFVRMPTHGRAQKTVLFCAGGPGQIVLGPLLGYTFADFLVENGYNVVYFHQRGAGFSQISASNRYDQYLKTSYVINDIEKIRHDFLGKDGKWDAIIGWSYGTVVAQQYTRSHAAEVDRLILIGPQSRDKFNASPDGFDELTETIRATNRETLTKIFDNNPNSFPDLTCDEPKCKEFKTKVVDTAFGTKENPGIYDKAEKLFGSVQWLVDFYCKPKTQEELKTAGLDRYSPEFFKRLRLVRMFGWLPESSDNHSQLQGAKTIANEVVFGGTYRCSGEVKEEPVDSSRRVFNVVGVYDGINMRFLNQWIKNGKSRIRDSLRESEGDAHLDDLEKVGIGDSESLRPWDPFEYRHHRPTLILKGGADTVSAGGQAERFYLDALTGPRTLITFPGIGHSFALPKIQFTEPILTGTVHVDPPPIEPGETRPVLGTHNRGETLDGRFRLSLEKNRLEAGLNLAGLGIFENGDGSEVASNVPHIIALIENTSDHTVDGSMRKWIISNNFFKGHLELDPPPIRYGKSSEVSGAIERAQRNEDHAVHVQKPNDLESGLELLCFTVTDGNKGVAMWFRNNNDSGEPVGGQPRQWTVSKEMFSSTFMFSSPVVPPQEVRSKGTLVPGLELEKAEPTRLIPPPKTLLESGLDGCLRAQAQEDDNIYVAVRNTNFKPEGVDGANLEWRIDNPMFTMSFMLDPPHFPPRGGDKVRATDVNIKWKWPRLKMPTTLVNSGLELRGFNVESDKEISILLRNSTKHRFDGIPRNWIYIDPNTNIKSACFKVSSALDCLIYSFLVMDAETFNNEQDNKMIGILKGFRAIVCDRVGDRQQGGKEMSDACP
jgi:pimeloyl-ACP methyl ester carboxylesterase